MHSNLIMTDCITPKTTPIIYALFQTHDVRVGKNRVELSPEMMQTLLTLNGIQAIPESHDAVDEVITKMIPNAKYWGCLARESDHSISLWNDRITIYKPDRAFNGMELARINWAAIGATEPEEAERFAMIMIEAAYIAKELNKKFR